MSPKKDSYLKTLAEVFENPEGSSQEKVMNLMDETLNFLKDINEKLKSGDAEAFKDMMEMKKLLESKMQTLTEKTGLDLTQLANLAHNPNNMTEEQRKTLEAAQGKLKDLKEENKQPFLINKI